MAATKEQIMYELVDAIGTRKKFDPLQKREFAEALFRQMSSAISFAKEHAKSRNIITDLTDATKQAERSIRKLITLVGQSSEGFNCDCIARTSVDHRLGVNLGLHDVLDYLRVFNESISLKPAGKTGRNNIAERYVAEMIAIKYKQFFKADPTHNKNPDTSPFPYDRICDLIEKHWGFEIPSSTREKAVETTKNYIVTIHDELI